MMNRRAQNTQSQIADYVGEVQSVYHSLLSRMVYYWARSVGNKNIFVVVAPRPKKSKKIKAFWTDFGESRSTKSKKPRRRRAMIGKKRSKK